MITIDFRTNPANNDVNCIYGKSTDTKPIGHYEGTPIKNGYIFYEMDTQDVYMYDGEGQEWIKQ